MFDGGCACFFCACVWIAKRHLLSLRASMACSCSLSSAPLKHSRYQLVTLIARATSKLMHCCCVSPRMRCRCLWCCKTLHGTVLRLNQHQVGVATHSPLSFASIIKATLHCLLACYSLALYCLRVRHCRTAITCNDILHLAHSLLLSLPTNRRRRHHRLGVGVRGAPGCAAITPSPGCKLPSTVHNEHRSCGERKADRVRTTAIEQQWSVDTRACWPARGACRGSQFVC